MDRLVKDVFLIEWNASTNMIIKHIYIYIYIIYTCKGACSVKDNNRFWFDLLFLFEAIMQKSFKWTKCFGKNSFISQS